MNTLKVWFSDFWKVFDYNNNFILDILKLNYNVIITEQADVLFFSCFGDENLKYNNILKIFFTGENIRPNFFLTDYSITYDFKLYNGKNFRWPLYNLYYDPLTKPSNSVRTKFCCMVVSNPSNPLRKKVFDLLSTYKTVDSGGKWLNNVGEPVQDKLLFLKQYKFCLCFENSSYKGYTTEKILEAKLAGCIPIYWGNPEIEKDFKKNSYISLHDFNSLDLLLQEIIKIDSDEIYYNNIVNEPLLTKNKYTEFSDISNLQIWLNNIINNPIIKKRKIVCSYIYSYYAKLITSLYNRTELLKYNVPFFYDFNLKKIIKKILMLLKLR